MLRERRSGLRRGRNRNEMMRIAIPHSSLEEASDDREAVRKIGYIGRAAAIFRVGSVYIYTHKGETPQSRARFIKRYLEYMVTPPYLRKDLFPVKSELRLAGLLPPLRLPVLSSKPRPGVVLMGMVVRWDGYASIVKVGEAAFARVPKPYPLKSRLLVQLENEVDEGLYRAHVVPAKQSNHYAGFSVEVIGIRELIRQSPLLLTGREGKPIGDALNELAGLVGSGDVTVVFGSPKRGVEELMRDEGIDVGGHTFVNFVPRQGVRTIRLEEAIVSVLSIVNLFVNGIMCSKA